MPPHLKNLLLFQCAAAAGALAFALIAQYGFGLHPCELCLAQRYPYALIIAIAALAFFRVKSPKMAWQLAFLCGLLFLVDSGIAFYHAGVELHWFSGPTACTSSTGAGETIEQLRAAIMNAPLVACDQAMASFMGLSMAAWNSLAAAILGIGSLVFARKIKPI